VSIYQTIMDPEIKSLLHYMAAGGCAPRWYDYQNIRWFDISKQSGHYRCDAL